MLYLSLFIVYSLSHQSEKRSWRSDADNMRFCVSRNSKNSYRMNEEGRKIAALWIMWWKYRMKLKEMIMHYFIGRLEEMLCQG
ncbi:hypothetical protein HNQ85_001227 [Anoxybacillus calidus]|uniref:Uncharacterized protein n=1 Tax=[Anoxybacillus] calidus TaxID=575178 RepID=A0A7V9YZ33_9BACL|nr:hypothetical protein [Anoxybacillus calidus]